MGRGKELTEAQKGGIIASHKLGHTKAAIARAVGCDRTTVSKFLTARASGAIKKRRSGRPRILDTPKRKALKESVLQNKNTRRQNLSEITKNFQKTLKGIPISEKTIRRALAEEGVRSCQPRPKPLITAKNKANRLAWALERRSWTVEDWKKIIWSDESTFSQFRKSGWGRVWREPQEEFHEDCIASTVKHSPSIMFWACFSYFDLGPIVPLLGRVNGVAHCETLAAYAIPTIQAQARKFKKKFSFQEDNAPAHTATVARSFLSQHVELLPWPAQSPDLNPIENLWNIVEDGIRKRNPQPSSLKQLEKMVKEEWVAISQDVYRNLIESMPRRLEAVISAKGGPTKY
jgi:transposase